MYAVQPLTETDRHCEMRPHLTAFGQDPVPWDERAECARPATHVATWGGVTLALCEDHGSPMAESR